MTPSVRLPARLSPTARAARAVVVAGLWLLAVPGLAAEPVAPAGPKPAEQLKSLIGVWKGGGTLTMGGQPAKVQGELTCVAAAGGAAVRCDGVYTMPDGSKQEESDLFAWSAQDNMVHWYAATSAGDAHDHKGGFAGNTLHVVYAGSEGGQLFTETLALTIESAKKVRNKCTVVVGGQTQAVIDVTMTR